MAEKKILVDLRVELEPPGTLYWHGQNIEALEAALKRWASELEDFIRDHRSQDPVGISVRRVYETRCEYCEHEWETDDYGRPVCCTAAQIEHEDEMRREDERQAMHS